MNNKKKSFCTICTAFCGIEVEVDGNQIVDIHADKMNPMSQGYSCSKGRNAHHLLTAPDRLTEALRKNDVQGGGNSFAPCATEIALDEISQKLTGIVEQHGAESVAVFAGNGVTFKTSAMPAIRSWMNALGSHQIYSTMSIDQPAKFIAKARYGFWSAGLQSFEKAEVLLLCGINPMVSGYHTYGCFPGWRPGALKDAKRRGMKLIVVDPRQTETAKQADIHLQIKPGEDAVLLSGMLNYILQQELYDVDFCNEHTVGIDELRQSVEEFDLDTVAALTGLEAEDITSAARVFAGAGVGTAQTGTGPNMAPYANVTEHLVESLNMVCGRLKREGDVLPPNLLSPARPIVAATVPTKSLPLAYSFEKNPHRSRIRESQQLFGEMPSATLAEEILTEGPGQIRALIVVAGNPALSWPDQDLSVKALESLDLLVCLDVRHSETCQFADYILPCSYGLERDEITAYNDVLYDQPYAQYAHSVVQPPGEAQEEWSHFAGLAMRMGLQMNFRGGALNLDSLPDSRGFLDLLYPSGRTKVPLAEMAEHDGGHVYTDVPLARVLPTPEGNTTRLNLFPEEVASEFATMAQEKINGERVLNGVSKEARQFQMICRRDKDVFNSFGHDLPSKKGANPLRVHPLDLKLLNLSSGDEAVVDSKHGELQVLVSGDATLKRGVVSISHCWGGDPKAAPQIEKYGSAVNKLVSTSEGYNSVMSMPQMTAIAVDVKPVP